MKTERKIKERLKQLEKQHKATTRRFNEDDCIDDYNLLPVEEGQIEILKWVLNPEA